MANQNTKDLEIMFENYVEDYDANCVISQAVATTFPSPESMQRAGDTFYRPQDYHMNVVTGLDVSGASKTDLIERQIPTVYRQPDNIIWELNAKEMRDEQHMIKSGQAASKRLAAEIDKNLYSVIANRAGMVVTSAAALSWEDAAQAEAVMLSRGISPAGSKLFMNPFDYKDVIKDLGNRAYMTDWSKSAYDRSQVPDIANFQTFRTDNQANLIAVGTVSGTTSNGSQSHTVTAMTGDVPTDNRQMAYSVSGANIANTKNGDAFSIAGINAVHNIDKTDTNQPMTFRIVSGGGTASLIISPAIIATGPYQNVTAVSAGGAALTFLNIADNPVNVFWGEDAVSLDYGKLAFPTDEGAKVMTANTKNGVPLIMSYEFDHLKAVTTVRFTTLYAATVLQPERCGIILPNQT